jgi:hypothetical protein
MTISHDKQEGRAMKLPPKPESVSHVTDAHWEAAIAAASIPHWHICWESWSGWLREATIDHARCLILLGEVKEPLDLFEAACGRIVQDWYSTRTVPTSMADIIRKHLAGMTIPEAGQ